MIDFCSSSDFLLRLSSHCSRTGRVSSVGRFVRVECPAVGIEACPAVAVGRSGCRCKSRMELLWRGYLQWIGRLSLVRSVVGRVVLSVASQGVLIKQWSEHNKFRRGVSCGCCHCNNRSERG
ncbi:expressed unknown protein [Seminavis robusta]|uniref:Uncharacterized protein n=1 Tax=Seminavis robusta TaxID=568900 RepID=A0A9N8DFR3_9STRA|nr:expressed unknown protein [Seminavis robusta]|eukprot:Sro67_g037620.1 n/a (122) ;mRNA; r:80992-81846